MYLLLVCNQLDTQCQQITDQQEVFLVNIHKTIQQLQEALEVRKTELIGQLNQITQRKLKTLAAQRDQIELVQTQLSSCLDFVKESLPSNCQRCNTEGGEEQLYNQLPAHSQRKVSVTHQSGGNTHQTKSIYCDCNEELQHIQNHWRCQHTLGCGSQPERRDDSG